MWNAVHAGVFICAAAAMFSVSLSKTPCQTNDRASCLEKVSTLALNQSAFWFGTKYKALCPIGADGTYECQNSKPNITDSLISRMIGDQSFPQDSLKFIVNVTYDLKSESYQGCSRWISKPIYGIKKFPIDPVDPKPYKPSTLVNMPEVSWPAETGDIFTLVFYDVGYLRLHSVYVNIKGGSPSDGQVVLPYIGPTNPLDRPNIYTFAVFRQGTEFGVHDVRRYMDDSRKSDGGIDLNPLMKKYNLTGPVGLNILRVKTDQYAAYIMRKKGVINDCPRYIVKNYYGYNIQLAFLPERMSPTISIDVLYNSSFVTYRSCCESIFAGKRVFRSDYTDRDASGPYPAYAVTVRNKPDISLVPRQLGGPADQVLAGKKYTLMLLDVSKTYWNRPKALVHWMVINIPADEVPAGVEAFPYTSPHPAEEGRKRSTPYIFLLYEQSSDLTVAETQKYGETYCVPAEKNRCDYRVNELAERNRLTLVGLRPMSFRKDKYSRFLRYSIGLTQKSFVCNGESHYPTNCRFTTKSPRINIPIRTSGNGSGNGSGKQMMATHSAIVLLTLLVLFL